MFSYQVILNLIVKKLEKVTGLWLCLETIVDVFTVEMSKLKEYSFENSVVRFAIEWIAGFYL